MLVNGFLEKAQHALFIPLFGAQKVHGLAVFVNGTIQIAPLALHLDIRLVHAPTDTHGTLAAVKRFFELGAIFDDSPIHSRVVQRNPTFLHKFFNVARAQWVHYVPADTRGNDLSRERSTLETDCHRLAPS